MSEIVRNSHIPAGIVVGSILKKHPCYPCMQLLEIAHRHANGLVFLLPKCRRKPSYMQIMKPCLNAISMGVN